MTSDLHRHSPVAIVGAGFSGTMVAAHLARRGIASVLIEGAGGAGLGTAFSTREPAHLLNVPASNMSAWPDAPEDFASREGGAGGRFAERRQFGRYLQDILDEATGSDFVDVVRDRVVGAVREKERWVLRLAGGGTVGSQAVVLATGNQPPAPLPFAEEAGDRLIDNPWGARAREAIEDAAARQLDAMILGTGLTMVDVVLSLDSAGHKGGILALSRRGLIPRSHEAYDPAPIAWDEIPVGGLRSMMAWLREHSGRAGWRAAIDSLRPHTRRLWQSLGLAEKRLFLRHARPWWDVHRHRIAPEVARRLSGLMSEGRLRVVAGRVMGASAQGEIVEVEMRNRGDGATHTHRFGWIFNCTGPLGEIGRTRDPLLRQLLDDGLVEPDELGIGIAVDERSRCEHSDRLWALGALTKGRYWEIIAVPDIRNQAAEVAADIATELAR
ncbi:MAG TPA: FAD/NAD(P)-binding protein [Sphingomicrobium sp.]|nr:FAD/NAD(P)-binding protein [Sphingomicrobium sp.]